MGRLHIKHKVFSCHHQGKKRDLLILDLEEWASFVFVTYYWATEKTCPGIKMCIWPFTKEVRRVYSIRPCVVTLWYYLVVVAGMNKCSYPHQDQCKSDSQHYTPLLICYVPFSLPQLHPTPPVHPPSHTHTSALYCSKWRLLSLIFSFLSSVHSLQRFQTYLALIEQCCSGRALKDRDRDSHSSFFHTSRSMFSYSVAHSYPLWYSLSASITCVCNYFYSSSAS